MFVFFAIEMNNTNLDCEVDTKTPLCDNIESRANPDSGLDVNPEVVPENAETSVNPISDA